MAQGLAKLGARVAVLGRNRERADKAVAAITAAGGEAFALLADVNNQAQLLKARDTLLNHWGKVDILVNAAGGNVAAANVPDDASLFDVPKEAFEQVFDLNLMGTLLPTQIFGRAMVDRVKGTAEKPEGCIVNVSSMAAIRVISRVAGYSAAKAAVDNFTRWWR